MENTQKDAVTVAVTKDKTIRSLVVETKSKSVIDGVLSMLKDGDGYAWAVHPAEGETPEHYHLVAKMVKPTKLGKFRTFAMGIDKNSYTATAKSLDGALRYLVHADNPEKSKIDQSRLVVKNWDHYEDILARPSRSRSGAAFGDLDTLQAVIERCKGRVPKVEDLIELMKLGHSAARIKGVLHCLSALRQWHAHKCETLVLGREEVDMLQNLQDRVMEQSWFDLEPLDDSNKTVVDGMVLEIV